MELLMKAKNNMSEILSTARFPQLKTEYKESMVS